MTEAKDTVMKHKQVIDLIVAWRKETLKTEPPKTADVADLVISTAEAQAEISFKAGMKKVVEWIEKTALLNKLPRGGIVATRWWINRTEWQAKLKEWGIE